MISYTFADTALLLHKGWQLIGSTSKITDMQIFDKAHVEQVWHYDASAQKWKGYSPQSDIAKKIQEKGYETISTLESWHGFWIKSKDEWVLMLPSENQTSDENITLQKGWNLISLPVDTVVSPHIFDGKTVWKYAPGDQWQLFDPEAKENFPAISHITNSDGIWVKSNKKQIISTVSDSAKLHNFATVEAMKNYIRDMLLTYRRPYCGYYPLAVIEAADTTMKQGDFADTPNEAPVTAQQADNASETNLQEERVDEADIIKHDNTRIFYLSSKENDFNRMQVNVTTFERITNNELSPLTTIEIEGNAVDLYLTDNKLIVLSKYGMDNYKPLNPTPAEKIVIQNGGDVSSMIVEIFNVEDITNIQRTHIFKINGQLNSSRLIDGKLYLITRFSPEVQITYPPIYVDAPECKEYFTGSNDTNDATPVPAEESGSPTKRAAVISVPNQQTTYQKYARCYTLRMDENGKFYRPDYEHPQISYEKLIPYYKRDHSSEEMLITPETFYASDKKDQEPTISTVSKIDIATGRLEKTSSVLGYNNTLYASQNALYMVSDQYPIFYTFDRFDARSIIYKFNLGEEMGYKAAGFVGGTVLNQFSLSEYNNTLRIATTSGNSWQNNTINRLYTLKTIHDTLLIQGVLSGLGKEGERIRSVRFLGDKGYIVTFRQTDPFYTLDLSDPLHPKKVGELKINGFSSYLHPVSEDLILGFGRDATPDGRLLGLKIELFSVSDFANPVSLDSYTLPGNYTRSEIEYNHKALAYRDSDKLLAFPYNLNQNYHYDKDYLGIFQIANNKINTFKALPGANENSYQSYKIFQRGLIFDMNNQTYVAYFSNGKINYATLDDLREE
jgi:uncharacterized secreted protein with C-terminal beta-propeller domain